MRQVKECRQGASMILNRTRCGILVRSFAGRTLDIHYGQFRCAHAPIATV